MTHHDIYRDQLGIKYPSYGHALWEPSPGRPDSCVEVGDVGFIREGQFHRLFNALHPAHHPSNERFGVPRYHEPLYLAFPHMSCSTLTPNYYCSAGVTVRAEPEYLSSRPNHVEVTFSCTRRQGGAVLFIPVPARRQNTLAQTAFAKWINRHIEEWFAFAFSLQIGIQSMNDVVFVTGRDCVKTWLNIAFFGGNEIQDSRVIIGHKVVNESSGDLDVKWRVSPENVHGALLNRGPEGMDLPEDQCIFIRGFRVLRTFAFLPKRLGAAAEFSSDPDNDDKDGDTDVYLATNSQDSLHLLLDYVAERAIDCDVALVHDDDLTRMDESLRPNILTGHFRGFNPNIYQVEYEDLSSTKSCSDMVGGIVKVATLSVMLHNQGHTSQFPLTSLVLQSSDMTEACYKQIRQSFQHCVTPILSSPCSVDQRHSTAGPTTTAGWKFREGVHAGLLQGSTVARLTQDLSMIMTEDPYMGRYLPISSILFNEGINHLQLNDFFVDIFRALAPLKKLNKARPYPSTQTAHPIVYLQYTCPWAGCTGGFGTPNDLHTHMIMRGHRNKRTLAEIKEHGTPCLEMKNEPGRLEWPELAEERCIMPSAMDRQSDVSYATIRHPNFVTTSPAAI